MASVYKKSKDRKRPGSSWYFAYQDAKGVRRAVKGCSDKAATEAMARRAESEADLRRRGVIDARMDALAAQEDRPLSDHVADWHAFLVGKGSTAKHASLCRNRVKKVVEQGGARRLAELTPSRVQAALKAVRDGGVSLRSLHHYTRAVKGFSRWLWRDGRTREDGLAHLTSPNPDADKRRVRRALAPDEQAKLIRAAEAGPVVLGMAGPDRAALYRLALGTGFRAAELRSLGPGAFRLDDEAPSVTVAAAYSKRRRDDVQPIRPDLAAALRPWLATRPADAPVFNLPERTADLIRADLAAAGVPYRTDSGIADFHGLRHAFITALAMSRAPVKVVQSLARHSTPTLTLGTYAHVGLFDQAAALDALPDQASNAPRTEPASLARTGTDPAGSLAAPGKRAPDVSGRFESVPVVIGMGGGESGGMVSDGAETLEMSGSDASGRFQSERRGRDSNPRDPRGPCGFQDRRNRPLCHPSGGLGSVGTGRAATGRPR